MVTSTSRHFQLRSAAICRSKSAFNTAVFSHFTRCFKWAKFQWQAHDTPNSAFCNCSYRLLAGLPANIVRLEYISIQEGPRGVIGPKWTPTPQWVGAANAAKQLVLSARGQAKKQTVPAKAKKSRGAWFCQSCCERETQGRTPCYAVLLLRACIDVATLQPFAHSRLAAAQQRARAAAVACLMRERL